MKTTKSLKTLVAVERERERERVSLYSTWNSFTRLYIVYCHLENKKSNLQNAKNNFNLEILKLYSKSKGRTILRLDMNRNVKSVLKNSYFSSIGLSFCAFQQKNS